MVIGASEGEGWRYEVVGRADGYLVLVRDLDTGAVEDEEGRVFRTATVALAYAELSACADRYAASLVSGEGAGEGRALAAQRVRFEALKGWLGDEGMAVPPAAWARTGAGACRLVLH